MNRPRTTSSQTNTTTQHQSIDNIDIEISNQYRLIDMKQITQLIGMTDKWIYSLIQKQLFPKPIKLGRSSRWRLKDIEMWIDTQAVRS